MKRGFVELFFFVILLSSFSSFACVTPFDCSAPSCTGSIPLCIEGECKYTDCLINTISQEEDLPDNSYYRYAYDIIDNINVSEHSIKTESGMYESILSWVKFNQTVMFMILTLGSIIIGIILVLLWQLIKSNAVMKIVALLLIVLLAALFVITFSVNPDLFTRLSQGDFSALSFSNVEALSRIEDNSRNNIIESSALSNAYMKAIDSNLEYAKEYRLQQTTGQATVLYLDFNNENSALAYIDNKVQATQKTKYVLGRIAYVYELEGNTGVYTYRIQDGDLVYFITGDEESISEVAKNIFTEKEDAFKKTVEIDFEDVKCRNSKLIEFKVYDPYELIRENNYSVVVGGTNGFDFNKCSIQGYGYHCEFNATLNFGKNNIVISVIQKSSNIKVITEKQSEFFFDNIVPTVTFDLSDKNKKLNLIYTDTGTGVSEDISFKHNNIDKKLNCVLDGLKRKCSIEDYLVDEGENTVITFFKDTCGNSQEAYKTFIVDTIPPKILSISSNPKIIEIEDISGIAKLKINSEDYDLNSCMIINGIYTCTITGNDTSRIQVYAEDLVGNKITKIV